MVMILELNNVNNDNVDNNTNVCLFDNNENEQQ